MTADKLVKGKTYVSLFYEEPNVLFQFKNEINEERKFINVRTKIYYKNATCCTAQDCRFREATNFEIAWLEECIKQNRFVSKEEIKTDCIIDNYEIF